MAATINEMQETESYAVASRSIEKAQAFASKWNFGKAYGSYEELVADSEIDLVYIATPHSHHYEHARLCILNGKPVLCENHLQPMHVRQKNLYIWQKKRTYS